MTTEILNCPFCGGIDIHVQQKAESLNHKGHFFPEHVQCRGCLIHFTGNKAIEKWNSRAVNDNTELSTLREKARFYDETVGQEPVGYVDIDMDNFYTFEEWPCYVPEDDNRQGIYPAYTKPVPQAMADAALQAVKDWDIAHYLAYGEFVVPEHLRKLIQKAVSK